MLDVQAAWSASLCCGPSGSSRNSSVTSEVGGSKSARTKSSEVMTGTVLRSVDLDDHLAERTPLADLRESGRHLVEPEGAVDVDPYVTCDAEVGHRLEVGGAFLDDQDAQGATGEPADRPTGGDHAQQ